MTMTKKQQAAIRRILKREAQEYERRNKNLNKNGGGIAFGLHSCGDGYVVTDGKIAIYFPDKPDGFPEGERMDSLYGLLTNACQNGDHTRVDGALPVAEWKELANQAKKTGIKACISMGSLQGYGFDPRFLLDALDAVGKDAVFYVGRSGNTPYPTILVFPENAVSDMGRCVFAYILPCKMKN